MNDTLIEQIQADAAALDIKITAQEITIMSISMDRLLKKAMRNGWTHSSEK